MGVPSTSRVVCALALGWLLVGSFQPLRSQEAGTGSVQGFVRNAGGAPVAEATVYLQSKGGIEPLSTYSDDRGKYQFSAIVQGSYTLTVTREGYGKTSYGPFSLTGPKQAKVIDVTLNPSGERSSSTAAPQFFDEPQFTVAGITDNSAGGHGSDVVQRNTEAMAKETASLSKDRPTAPQAAASAAQEKKLRETAGREAGNADANFQLGKFLVDDGRAAESLPYLERASELRPQDFETSFELARAYASAGQFERARTQVRALLGKWDKADLHRLLADADEKLGDPLNAAREYQRAVELDASESNLFAWGEELLMHDAPPPAIEVFDRGHRLFPKSARMLVGLGVALYGQGLYEEAAKRLCEATDLEPEDPAPYLFLGKVQSAGNVQSDEVLRRLERFARLQPGNAQANYDYAVALWMRREGSEDARTTARVEELLQKAVRLDANLGPAFLQLGILYADRKDYLKAIDAYQKASEASPDLAEPHLRLAQVYKRTGNDAKAATEQQVYQQLSKRKTEEVERERHEMQQFVLTPQNGPR